MALGGADSGAFADVGAGLAALSGTGATNEETTMMSQSLKLSAAVAGFALLTAGCGDRPVDRALTGGAIGAGAGAVVGSTVGSPVGGAVVGGAAGATIGAVTAPER
jgi:hypothetical protein